MPRMVLVVDDSSTIQEAVRHALAGEPWEAVSAASGEEAEDKLQSGRFDVVLCDVDLGDEDGFGVCRRIREVSPSRAAPVVLMGARVTPAGAAAAGATATLTKPFSSEELLGALQEAVEMQSFGMDDLELETTDPVAETRKGPSVPPAAEEEVEIIDLSDEEDLSEFELLEDLEPIEVPPSPLEEEPAFGLDDLLSLGDEGEPDGTDAKPLDLDAGGGGSTPANATETEPGEIGDLLASLPADEGAEAALPLAEADGADEIGDLLESLAPEQGLERALVQDLGLSGLRWVKRCRTSPRGRPRSLRLEVWSARAEGAPRGAIARWASPAELESMGLSRLLRKCLELAGFGSSQVPIAAAPPRSYPPPGGES